MTRDYAPLEPTIVEHRLYARGVGPVFVPAISGGTEREELIAFEAGRP